MYGGESVVSVIDVTEDLAIAKILMVDDDTDDLFLTKLSFEKSKFPFKFTGLKSADALFEYVEKTGIADVDILLLDLNMPGIGGLEALKDLRKNPEFEKIKVFMFSSSSSVEDRDLCVEAGADGYLFKPSDAQQVTRFVNTVALASDFWV